MKKHYGDIVISVLSSPSLMEYLSVGLSVPMPLSQLPVNYILFLPVDVMKVH